MIENNDVNVIPAFSRMFLIFAMFNGILSRRFKTVMIPLLL